MAEPPNPNFSRPDGAEGIDTLREMNDHHRGLSEWGLSLLPRMSPGRILDVGCGGGMFISLLAERFEGSRISGIDHSPDAVSYASEYNSELIDSGRCDISVASVSELPFGDGTFDLVTAVETYFFWPDLENDLVEVSRVLSGNGTLMIVAESYPHPDFDERNARYGELYGMDLVTNERMADILGRMGFDVTVRTVEGNNWVAFVAERAH